MQRSVFYRPEMLLVASFFVLIVVGTLLLRLPAAHAEQPVGLVDALFTSTSATCVTGLITRETATDYSRFGQCVILGLIQLGGLGIMAFGALAAQVFNLRTSLATEAAWRDAFFDRESRGDLRRALGYILLLTVLFEGVGTGFLYHGLQSANTVHGGVFEAMFLSISAFCNAGFSVYSDSAAGLRHSSLMMCTLMSLIVAGGLGYVVWLEVYRRAWCRVRRREPQSVLWSLHSRIVLRGTVILVASGAALLLLLGAGSSAGSIHELSLHALFQSISARTAGFSTLDVGGLSLPALLVLVVLMFIGGSPGSCAGGVKTTTAAVWVSRVRARLLGRDSVTLGGREVPHDVVRRAALVLSIAALWNLAGIMLLSITEGSRPGVRFEHLVFEQVSAFATVGLSTGLTPTLTVLGKLWIIASMFVGRLGPLTVALAILRPASSPIRYPTESVMIG